MDRNNIKDYKFLGRDVSPEPLEIVDSKGNYLIDSKGKKYLDFFMGWCVGNIGWKNEDVMERIKKFDGPSYVYPNYIYKPWIELAELLAKITPGKLEKSFRATGGTEAVEIAMQASMSYTGRSKFISVDGGYHGHSIGTMSLGLNYFRRHYNNLLTGCCKIKPPLDKIAAEKIVKLLRKKDIAAFIMEPIICNLGVVSPDGEFMTIVQKACKKYETVLIMDEVATGFLRTGEMFASEHYKMEPDIMCLGKAVTGGFGGLGVAIMTKEIAKSMEFGCSFYSTFGWHPLSVEAALGNIGYILKNKGNIRGNVLKMEKFFRDRLEKMNFKYPAEVRCKGLAIGVEFENQGYATDIVEKCQKNGLLISDPDPTFFTLFPSLNIDEATAKEGLDILEKCI